MEPPSYEEARRHPAALSSVALNVPPPPSYDISLNYPPTPPPTYGEAVTLQPDPFPVLNPPRQAAPAARPSQSPGVIVHQATQIGARSAVSRGPPQPVVTQPRARPVPVALPYLRDIPALVTCPYCRHVVTTKVTYIPGKAAWCMCLLLTLMGLVCGFCLIPFMVRSLQDAHHSCPRCGKDLHTYTR